MCQSRGKGSRDFHQERISERIGKQVVVRVMEDVGEVVKVHRAGRPWRFPHVGHGRKGSGDLSLHAAGPPGVREPTLQCFFFVRVCSRSCWGGA